MTVVAAPVEIREVNYTQLGDAEHASLARLFQLIEWERVPHARAFVEGRS